MDTDVAVIGAGPVGLLLGARLIQLGLDVRVLDERSGPAEAAQSRAIGIHPPSLERLATLGVADAFIAEGVRITRGRAVCSRGLLGCVDLSRRPGRHRFVLSLPQSRTEAILARRLSELRDGVLHRNTRVVRVEPQTSRVRVTTQHAGVVHARFAVGCDGAASLVRHEMGVAFRGGVRRERYVMADVADDTPFASEAVFFLSDDGLVESLPLPQGRRRWVAERQASEGEGTLEELVRLVERRTGYRVDPATASMLSTYDVKQLCVRQYVSNGLVLCGDAAHALSPFGGQGMNLGWLDAWDLASCLRSVVRDGLPQAPALADYERRRRRAAGRAMRRAALYRRIGHRPRRPRLRNGAVRLMLLGVPDAALARLFTMAGFR